MRKVHLFSEKATLETAGKRAFTLNVPPPVALSCPLSFQMVWAVVRWLDVENSPRYLPSGGSTFCNIYAADLFRALCIYFPRVWGILSAGEVPVYGKNVFELNANALVDWMEEYGEQFGWELLETPAPRSAFPNHIGVIIGKKAKGHGHVQVLINGRATQAGSNNFENGEPYSADWWAKNCIKVVHAVFPLGKGGKRESIS